MVSESVVLNIEFELMIVWSGGICQCALFLFWKTDEVF